MTTTTLSISGAQLTVATEELFKAWVEKHISQPTAAATALIKPELQDGERYVGGIIRPDLTGYHLIRMKLYPEIKLRWDAAMNFACEHGGDLSFLTESALTFATREENEFVNEWYWTREQHAGNVDYAWCQSFGYGDQDYNHKDNQYRVVLVRRVPIQSLSH